MNLKLETEFSKAPILQQVDALKKQIDDMRPLPEDVEGRVMQKLRLDWNYHSNAIEGNKLNYGETVAFLMEGITAKGKPLKDHLDIRGHNEAINFLLSIVKDTRPISEANIRELHTMILVEPYDVKAQTADGLPTTKRITLGEYKKLPNHVKTATGETHYYATPEDTPAKMQELMEWYSVANADDNIHPVVAAALFHHKFVSIHPFDDGNGRLSRILMNLVLMQKGYPPVVIKMDDRTNYYALLSRADNGDNWPFIEYISESLLGSLQLYLKAAKGGDIDEDEDIDKEIALFKMELQSEILNTEKKSESVIKKVFEKSIKKLVEGIYLKANKFDDMFTFNNRSLDYLFKEEGGERSIRDSSEHDWIFKRLTFEDCKSIYINCYYHEFKNNSTFSIEVRWIVNFYAYNYTITNQQNKEVLNKQYQESISDVEQSHLTRLFIQDIKSSIQKNISKTKSPPSN